MNRSHSVKNRTLAAVSLGIAAPVAVLAGCSSSTTLDSAKLNTQIVDQINQVAPNSNPTVSCPSDVKAEANATFTCTATVAGQEMQLTVTQKDADGNVSYQGDSSIFQLASTQEKLSAKVAESQPGTWTTACNPTGAQQGYYIAKPGTTFDCEVSGTAADGTAKTGTLAVTVTDADGNVSLAFK